MAKLNREKKKKVGKKFGRIDSGQNIERFYSW